MSTAEPGKNTLRSDKLRSALAIVIIGIVINLVGDGLTGILGIPLYLDSIGTILASAIGGYLPGICVGILTNALKQFTDNTSLYYGTLSVLVAVCTTVFIKNTDLKKFRTGIAYILALAIICGGLGGVLTWFLFGNLSSESLTGMAALLESMGFSRAMASVGGSFCVDLADKFICVAVVFIVIRFLPDDICERYHFDGWMQAQLTREQKRVARHLKCRVLSLRFKTISLLVFACVVLGLAATSISSYLYRDSIIKERIILGEGTANLIAASINPDRVPAYLERGMDASGYTDTMRSLYAIMDTSPDIQYVYVYKIRKDGCHVVFDLEPGGFKSVKADTVIPFDESFKKYVPQLLKGESIEPIIYDGSYGWLLTVYAPVQNDYRETICYACVDISMARIRANEYAFFAKLISLFLQIFILVLAVGLWFVEYSVVLPVNTIALAAGNFAYNSENARYQSIRNLKGLKIRTGDEIENLYNAFLQTTNESMDFVNDVQMKTGTIAKMQNGLIFVLADIVESRDKNTGQHVRKTAAYTRIIMDQMRREGMYKDQLTDGFISDVANFAPLHDIGKISIPDAILNKPGRLTKEEFEQMKSHTTVGRDIISQVIEIVPESDYMDEARNLAGHHHERWDGKGYPDGLAGEDIPLSARIMAVADVFDALVSKRSYKKGFSFEKSMSIIEEGVGTQFDPLVAKAFLHARDRVYEVAVEFGEVDEDGEDQA